MTRTRPRLLAALLGPLVIAATLVATAAPASAATPLADFSISSTDASSVFGQSVILVASLTGTGASPTGTINFFDDASPLCSSVPVTQPIDGFGQANCTTSTLSVGNHGITASYSGDATYSPGTTSSFSQVVAAAGTTTGIEATPSPSVFTGPVTLTATVLATAPGGGTPGGAVAFKDNGVDIAGCSTQTLTEGSTTCVTTALAVASHPLTAVYAGNASYFTSTSSSVSQNVTMAATTTVVATSNNSTVFGESVTFTATTTPTAPATIAPSTGTVSFNRNGTTIATCGARAIVSGTSTCSTTALPTTTGPGVITAVYSGDASYGTSTSPGINQTVGQAATTTELTAAPAPSVYTGPVTLTATVLAAAPGDGTPTGTVGFQDAGVTISGCGSKALASGVATCDVTQFAVASHNLSAAYGGATSFTASSDNTVQVVNKASTTTTVVSNDSTTAWAQPVTFTATVAAVAPATLSPSTGTVTFTNGGTVIPACGTQPLSGSTATCTTNALPAGNNTVAAVYSGNANYFTSTAPNITQMVSQAVTTVALTANDNPASSDQAVTFTATVSASAPSEGVPSGTVAFFRVRDDLSREWIATSPLIAGVATATTSTLPFGVNTISAVYRGSNDASGSSSTFEESIYTGTATTVTSTRNPAMARRFIGFWATVRATTAGGGTPTGTVAFFRVRSDATREWIGNATLQSGVAKVRTDEIPVGTHTIVAVFRGGPGYSTSTGSVTQVITTG
jgi:hypothetical protein